MRASIARITKTSYYDKQLHITATWSNSQIKWGKWVIISLYILIGEKVIMQKSIWLVQKGKLWGVIKSTQCPTVSRKSQLTPLFPFLDDNRYALEEGSDSLDKLWEGCFHSSWMEDMPWQNCSYVPNTFVCCTQDHPQSSHLYQEISVWLEDSKLFVMSPRAACHVTNNTHVTSIQVQGNCHLIGSQLDVCIDFADQCM